MHHPTDRITHTTAFVTPVVEHWLEREIAQWVHHKDRSDDPSHHDRTLLSRSYISLPNRKRYKIYVWNTCMKYKFFNLHRISSEDHTIPPMPAKLKILHVNKWWRVVSGPGVFGCFPHMSTIRFSYPKGWVHRHCHTTLTVQKSKCRSLCTWSTNRKCCLAAVGSVSLVSLAFLLGNRSESWASCTTREQAYKKVGPYRWLVELPVQQGNKLIKRWGCIAGWVIEAIVANLDVVQLVRSHRLAVHRPGLSRQTRLCNQFPWT